MRWRNTTNDFGLIAISLHWLVAFVVLGLFALGLWMTELDYYSAWYKTAPDWHKSMGLLLAFVVIFRLVWRLTNPPPQPLSTHTALEIKAAHAAHLLLYILLLVTFVSGYLISTADGRPIEVFGWFAIPATITSIPRQEDIAGWIHFIVASMLVALAGIHALAALKHHFIDRDQSLKRMLGH